MNDLNLAFYAYFYGSNNNKAFKIPELPSLEYNCYYYTNNESMLNMLKQTNWIGIYDDKPTNDDLIESCMVGKHVKTMPHEYKELNGYDYLCYLDSKLERVNINFIEECINRYFIEQNYALLLRQHWFVPPNVYNELHTSMEQHRYVLEKDRYELYISKQINSGLSAVTPVHCACNVLIRNMKHEKINEINTTWYNHVQECGIQDQISFFFVKQLFPGSIFVFSEDPSL
jgi:hypothetical protein